MTNGSAVQELDWYPKLNALAAQYGWRVKHDRAVQQANGRHLTALMGDPGWPDFTFSHPARKITIFREIKGAKTRVEGDQKKWLASLAASGLDVDIWRMPDDWPRAVATLSFGRASPEQSLL